MPLAGWIAAAVIAFVLLGFAIFKIGSAQYKNQPRQAHSFSNAETNEVQGAERQSGATNEESHYRGFLKTLNDYSGALLAAFTLLLAVFTWRLYCATRDLVKSSERVGERQIAELQRSAGAAVKAADTAADSVKQARETARLDQRAWIAISGIEGFPELNKPIIIRANYTNTGKTLARKVKGVQKAMLVPIGDPINFSNELDKQLEQRTTLVSNTIVPPGGVSWIDLRNNVPDGTSDTWTQEVIDALKANTHMFFVFGRFDYEDIFECHHWVTFCSFLAYRHGSWSYMCYEQFNDADNNNCP